jgi:hypothetical protein
MHIAPGVAAARPRLISRSSAPRAPPAEPDVDFPRRAVAGPAVVDVSHLPPPASFDAGTRAKLLRLADDAADGVCVRGQAAAVAGFADVWRTAFVRLRGVPDEVVGTVPEVAAYVAALHAALAAKYRDLDVPMPSWRSWPGLRKRWAFLPPPPPPHPPSPLRWPVGVGVVPRPVAGVAARPAGVVPRPAGVVPRRVLVVRPA